MSTKNRKNNCHLEFGDRLRLARKSVEMTQIQAATEAGVSVQSWREYEAGRVEPAASKLAFFSRKGVSLDWLISGEGQMNSINGISVDEKTTQTLHPPAGTRPVSTTIKTGWKSETPTPGYTHTNGKVIAKAEPAPGRQPKPSAPPAGAIFQDLVVKTMEILQSQSCYSSALESNILAFHEAVKKDQDAGDLQDRIAQLENQVANIRRGRDPGQEGSDPDNHGPAGKLPMAG